MSAISRLTHVWFFLTLLSAVSGTGLSAASAGAAAFETAVESGREALRSRTRFPWYDADRDALHRIDVRPPKDPAAHRRSEWEEDSSARAAPSPSSGRDWNMLRAIVQVLLWAGLLALLVWLVFFLVRSYLRQHAAAEVEQPERDRRVDEDVIESLPFDIARPQTDLLAEARRLYQSGAYAQAVVYLFSYQLVQLDRRQHIRLARGKTNRQYLRELQSRPDLRGLLERTMVAFEEVFFGHYPLNRDGFERCWERLDEFHQRLAESMVSDG